MNQLAAQLAAQTAQVQQARAQSHHQLASVNPTAEISDVSGVNSAWRWLSSTAVEGTGLVSFQDNLKELDKLVEYFYKQVRNVLNAFEQTDSAASSSLNGAAASVFSGNRRPEDPPPGSYESMPGSGPSDGPRPADAIQRVGGYSPSTTAAATRSQACRLAGDSAVRSTGPPATSASSCGTSTTALVS